jgi:hypothetical protein
MRLRIGSTVAVIAIAVGLASSVAGPVFSALDGSSNASPTAGTMRPNRVI